MLGRKATEIAPTVHNVSTVSPKQIQPQHLPLGKTGGAASSSSALTTSTDTSGGSSSSNRSATPNEFEHILGIPVDAEFGLNKGGDDVIYTNSNKNKNGLPPSSSNSSTSPGSLRNATGNRNYFHHHNGGDTNSLLGVIVDRSSFDEDDELTTFGGNMAMLVDENISSSVIHEHPDELHMMDNSHDAVLSGGGGLAGSNGGLSGNGGGGGIVMRNGKIRRKLRWKPRFGRQKQDGFSEGGDKNFSSNASVISALTNRSVSTNRSTSTSKSFLSHFSRKSQTSFHTFHSTETPVATNKANRPQAPHTVMRPNYQDSFDVAKNIDDSTTRQQSTIDNEGHQSKLGANRELNHVDMDRSSSLPDRLNNKTVYPISPRSPLSLSSPISSSNNNSSLLVSGSPSRQHHMKNNNNDVAGMYSSDNDGGKEVGDTTNALNQSSLSSQIRSKRPPLFKGRLRNRQSMMNNNADGNNNNNDVRPTSPHDTSQTSLSSAKGSLTAHTSPTTSLSASLSLNRENSILPVLSGDEHEEHRRVAIHTTTTSSPSGVLLSRRTTSSNPIGEDEKKDSEDDNGFVDLLMEEEGIEESSLSPTVAENSVLSESVTSFSSAPAILQRKASISTTSGTTPPLPSNPNSRDTTRATSLSANPGSVLTQRSSALSGNLFSRRRGLSATTVSGAGTSSNSTSSAAVAAAPAPQKRYNRPVDSSIVLSGIKISPTSPSSSSSSPLRDNTRRTKSSNNGPIDLDEGAFLEAEHNLRAIHEMATEHLAHGEYEEAIDVFEEILRGQQERYGQDHYRVGTALHNLGIVYLKKGDYEKAIEICSRAVQVRKEALVPNHPDVAVSLAQLGVAYLESNQYRRALEAFQDALHIRRNFLGPRHPKCSKILNNIGCALYSMEEFVESKRAFSEALDIQRDTLRHLPSAEGTESNGTQSNALLLSMASTLCNIGSIRLRWGEFDRAIVALDEALLIQQSVLGDDHPTVESTLDSIEVVETARDISRQTKKNNNFLIGNSDAVCNHENPSNIIEMLGLSTLEAMAPSQWFQNPCGPITYTQEEDGQSMTKSQLLKTKKRRDGSSNGSQRNGKNATFPLTSMTTTKTTATTEGPNEIG